MTRHCIGIDLGTSGVRAEILDAAGASLGALRSAWPVRSGSEEPGGPDDPDVWWAAVSDLLRQAARRLPDAPVAIAVDGTSATLLAVDGAGDPIGPALMYNDARALDEGEYLRGIAPPTSAAHGASSSAAKLLWLRREGRLRGARRVLHQAEWISGLLQGRHDQGDENNALKLGYDPMQGRWPDWWLRELGPVADLLPEIVPAGTPLGRITAAVSRETGLHRESRVVAGTTDGIAGFLATGVDRPGTGVTSLGSTLVLKQLAEQPLFDRAAGVYSHRVLNRWLTGGASNSGGAALAAHFTPAEIQALARDIDPTRDTELDYYPLLRPGERFPVSDPALQPRLTPRPATDAQFLQGLLEGIARIEAAGYQRLRALGAPPVTAIVTVGGGAANPEWTALRARIIGVPVLRAEHEEAARGAALLAAIGAAAL
ncbi:MAG: FGGY-family carbohydrate kinase [Thioalkalivibrio sp.]|nr:FGGY-family carbohydrate kinase [Thioalkalivibrio sp.]